MAANGGGAAKKKKEEEGKPPANGQTAGTAKTTMTDDERVAVGLKVGISNYVATAALAVLAGALALYTYIAQNFSPSWFFYASMGAGALCLVTSIFAGGIGADFSVAEAAGGRWANPVVGAFNWQAGLTLLALLLIVGATAVGTTSDRAADGSTDTRAELVREVRRLRIAAEANQSLQARVAALENEVRGLEAARRR
jgi:hypothetical protein